MLILNGRIHDDKFQGECTWYDTRGNASLIDYVITSAKLFNQINEFKIQMKVPESDHKAIIVSIKCSVILKDNLSMDTNDI